ncbi:MAG: hypothetical protein NVSMB46_04580 [Candidatus Saccharimonadales bacterium]
MIKKILKNLRDQQHAQRDEDLYRKLVQHEAQIGGTLFGPLPKGVRREFFCLDENTWVWHEERTDAKGKKHTVTTRYEIHPNGILKVQNGMYHKVSANEAMHLNEAVKLYVERMNQELYGFALTPA